MTERWDLAAGFVPHAWAIALVAIGASLAIAEAVWTFRRPAPGVSRRNGVAILALRLLAIAALVSVAFELTLRIEQVAPNGRRVVVLVDRSASIALADAVPGDEPQTRQSRLEAVWEASKDARAQWVDDGLLVDVRGFDTATTPYTGELAQTLATTPDGGGSDLARALTELSSAAPDERAPLVAAVVLSDGLVATDSAGDRHIKSVAAGLGVPVTTVSLGAPELVDASVADVRAGEFAFVENVTEIEASVVAHGLRGKTTTLSLLRDGEVVHRRSIALLGDGIPQSIRFEVAPDRVGQFVYEIDLGELPGEATTANNRRAFVVKVLRDKVRVLHVAGRPDWDVRALRTLLRRDPNVELLSYYILRGFDDIDREDTSAPLSLIPFPTDELFEEQLGSFDLVILHNFDAVKHQVGQYVDNIAQYLAEGGGLVLIGGDLGLSDGGYAPGSLSSLLPVDTTTRAALDRDKFRPSLTEAGRRHPITAWLGATAEGWGNLPALDTFNPLALNRRANRIGASVLLEHPTSRTTDGSPAPLLAVAEPAKGRALVLATGSTWRMGFAPDLPLIDGARPYDLLWLGAVRWLLHDDASGRLTLETDKPRVREGEPVELRASTLTASYAPEPRVEVKWSVQRLGAPEDADPVAEGRWETDALGRAATTLENLEVGAYAATARRSLEDTASSEPSAANDDPATEHQARRVFIVEPPGRELAKIDADRGIERLRDLADETDAEFVDAAAEQTLPDTLPLADPSENQDAALRVEGRKDIPLWNGWIALTILVLAYGGEWLLRRRTGHA